VRCERRVLAQKEKDDAKMAVKQSRKRKNSTMEQPKKTVPRRSRKKPLLELCVLAKRISSTGFQYHTYLYNLPVCKETDAICSSCFTSAGEQPEDAKWQSVSRLVPYQKQLCEWQHQYVDGMLANRLSGTPQQQQPHFHIGEPVHEPDKRGSSEDDSLTDDLSAEQACGDDVLDSDYLAIIAAASLG